MIDNRDLVAVNLLRSQQWPISHSDFVAHFAMNRVEAFQDFGFVVRNIDPRNSLDKAVAANLNRGERRKKFNRSPRDHRKALLRAWLLRSGGCCCRGLESGIALRPSARIDIAAGIIGIRLGRMRPDAIEFFVISALSSSHAIEFS